MQLRIESIPLTLQAEFRSLLEEELKKAEFAPQNGAVLSFRDPDFTPEAGGFHPVEIAVAPDGSIQYVTDFAYYGRPPQCELAKELDFDFSLGLFQHCSMEFPITEAREMFTIWQENFLSYVRMGAYAVTVVPYG